MGRTWEAAPQSPLAVPRPVNITDFDYYLPPELIAQTPAEPRDRSRLLVLRRKDGMNHSFFHELPGFLEAGDVLVFNNSRVLPARLRGRKPSGGKVEVLLLRRLEQGLWEALVRPGRRVVGTAVEIARDGQSSLGLEIGERTGQGTWLVRMSEEDGLERVGEVPLPPYIHTPLSDPERYQTVYARVRGSAAAPTAGLHFTLPLLEVLGEKGVELLFVTLHIGLDTFRPVREENPRLHPVYKEYGEISPEVAGAINKARAEGRRVIAVGTTATRLLEMAGQSSSVEPFSGWVELFILPGYTFKVIDGLITNFHLPRSTTLMLAAAFAGRERLLEAYHQAIASAYRFYSFGDGMLIV